jgi:hypothetical protein
MTQILSCRYVNKTFQRGRGRTEHVERRRAGYAQRGTFPFLSGALRRRPPAARGDQPARERSVAPGHCPAAWRAPHAQGAEAVSARPGAGNPAHAQTARFRHPQRPRLKLRALAEYGDRGGRLVKFGGDVPAGLQHPGRNTEQP